MLVRGNKLCNFVVRPTLRGVATSRCNSALTLPLQEWREYKLVYRRYASLYFCVGVDPTDNELITLEARPFAKQGAHPFVASALRRSRARAQVIHSFVEVLDKYFGSVCELDLIFNFHKAYYILDEVLLAGELQEPSKRLVGRLVAEQDALADSETPEADR